MAQNVSVLVVASVTAASPELIAALQERAKQGNVRATLVMPAGGPGLHARDVAQPDLDEALQAWRDAGLTQVDGIVGDQDPCVAATEAWDPSRYDEVIVSTLPGTVSRWLRADLPQRLGRAIDARVTHVLSSPPREPVVTEPAPAREKSPLGPLSVLGWGHPRDESDEERTRRRRELRQ
jgi:hypothetical protein